jgi:hypothetical protein
VICGIIALLINPVICHLPELLPTPRPAYTETFGTIYGPNPDCANRDMHIRYLTTLKKHSVTPGDDRELYDRSIDQYIERLRYYCQ